MFQEISYALFFGMPLIFWLGLTTLIFLLSTFSLGILIYTNKVNVPIKYHLMLAITTVTIALIHGFFGLALYLP